MTIPRFRIIIGIACVAAWILVVGSFLVWGYLSVRVSLDAEKTLGAYRLVLEVIADYLKQSGGKWPKSWEELSNTQHGGYVGLRWPSDLAEIKKRIRIDFDLTTTDVISTDYNHFTAVQQVGPNYGPYPWVIAKFLYDARQSVAPIRDPPAQKGPDSEDQGRRGP